MEKDLCLRSEKALHQGVDYVKKHGLYSYDVNDIKGLNFIVKTYKSKLGMLPRYGVLATDLVFPKTFRKLFKVEKMITAGGIGIYLNATCNYYKLTNNQSDLDRAEELVMWLKENASKTDNGLGWGFPFDWQSVSFVPKHSPIGHTTMTCVNGLLNYYSLNQTEEVKDLILKSCEFFTKDLYLTKRPSGSYALSYTTYDQSQVINTNADIAAVLMRVGYMFDNAGYIEFAKHLFDFVIENQNEDGSWGYYANDAVVTAVNSVDNYHTGMVLSALNDAIEVLTEDSLKKQYMTVLEKGTDFYLKKLFSPDGWPYLTPEGHYPIDSYSCGQSIFTLCTLHVEDKKMAERVNNMLDKVVKFVITKMQNNDGSFVTKKYQFVNYNIGSLRWSQAMICLALTEVQLNCKH